MGRIGARHDDSARAVRAVLFVSDERAWPSTSGYRRRTAQIVSALAAIGPITWIAAPRNRLDPGGPLLVPEELKSRIEPVLAAAPTRSRAATARRWLTGGLPWPLAAGDWTGVAEELRRRRTADYQVVWAMGLDAMAAVERAGVEAPVMIIDADLESLKLQRQLDVGGFGFIRRRIAGIDVGRWARLERRAAAGTTGFSLCSEDEQRILGRGFVTPNSYPRVAGPVSDVSGRDPGVLLFVGSLGYQPNVDGLAWFVDEILPPLRRRHRGLSLRVVGAGLDSRHRLRAADGIEFLGGLDDLAPELGRAGGVVVPLRWGAGTRIKILEAFAHRVPVVSTTVGAEGLAVTSGCQLMVADDGPAFVEACSEVLTDAVLAAGLVDRAHRTFTEHYEESVVSHRLVERVEQMLAGGR